jgi:peptidylprolyl isomerase
MRLKSLVAMASAMLFAGSLAAQRPQNLPTSKITVPVAGTQVDPRVTVPALDPENTLNLDLSSGGRVVLQLRPDVAPNHVQRIKTLTRQNFYNGLVFHRVIEGFMAQGGDPSGDGTGGSELPDLAAEFNDLPHVRGTLSAARAEDPNSANSQFFIMLAPRFSLDGKYTVFGRVVGGMQFVDAIEKGEPPVNPTRILRASIGADNLAPPRPGEAVPTAARAAPPVAAPPPAAPTPEQAAPKPQ